MRWVVVKVEEDGGCSAHVGVAAVGVVFDRFGRVEREERERGTGGLLRTLHLQDCSKNEGVNEWGLGRGNEWYGWFCPYLSLLRRERLCLTG